MKLKFLEPKDIKKVMKIENESFTKSEKQTKEDLLETIKCKDHIGIIATNWHGKPLGYVLGAPIEIYDDSDLKKDSHYGRHDTFYGESLAVVSEERKKGIGSLLFATMLLMARKKGYERYTSFAHTNLGFRKKFNPKIIEELEDYWGKGVNAIQYEIGLNSLIKVDKNVKRRG
jgi:predicted N-acetyltransferase YhbS